MLLCVHGSMFAVQSYQHAVVHLTCLVFGCSHSHREGCCMHKLREQLFFLLLIVFMSDAFNHDVVDWSY